MSLPLRILGLLFAAAIGYGLYQFWPTFWSWIRGPWANDLRNLVMLFYAIGGLWIAEKIWGWVERLWPDSESAG